MAQTTIETAYRQYFSIIRERCRRWLRDAEEAEDVAQETFIRLWKKGPIDEDPRRILAWAYRVSTRLAIDRLRARRAHGNATDTELEQVQDLLDTETIVLSRRTLMSLAHHIPPDELEIALLHRVDRMTQPEIAEVSGVSERTVRRVLQRFESRLEKLKQGSTDDAA